MPRGSWLGLVVCVAFAAPAAGQGPPRALPPTNYSSVASPPAAGNAAPSSDGTIKELPGFGDLIPPPDPHAADHGTPGCLTPTVPGHSGFYGTAEYLLFRPRTDGMDYAIQNATTGLATTGPVRTAGYDLSSGVRAELGYRFVGDWDMAVAYTYFVTGGGGSSTAGPGQVLLPTLTRPGLTDNATSATSEVNINYNVFDLTAGKRFTVGENFAVRGFGGFRFAEINQRFNAVYNGLDANLAAVNTQSRFSGFGPLIGAEGVLSGWGGFHAYGRASGGLITGRSKNSLLETNDAGATLYANPTYNLDKIVPVASIAIGGGWQYRTISIRAGYEVTQWFGLTQPIRFVDDVGQGKISTRPANLSLEGLFLQVGLAF